MIDIWLKRGIKCKVYNDEKIYLFGYMIFKKKPKSNLVDRFTVTKTVFLYASRHIFYTLLDTFWVFNNIL